LSKKIDLDSFKKILAEIKKNDVICKNSTMDMWDERRVHGFDAADYFFIRTKKGEKQFHSYLSKCQVKVPIPHLATGDIQEIPPMWKCILFDKRLCCHSLHPRLVPRLTMNIKVLSKYNIPVTEFDTFRTFLLERFQEHVETDVLTVKDGIASLLGVKKITIQPAWQRILQRYFIFNKKDYHKWLVEGGHPDKGGDTSICIEVMNAAKKAGFI